MTAEDVSLRAEDLLRHRGWVRGLARSLVARESEVDDLEQETWLAALERGAARGAPGTTWLGRVVRSRAVDLFRRGTRRAARERAASRPETVPSAAQTVARAEAHRAVVGAVMALEEPFRTAVLLRYFEDLPPREVARRTGVGVETARTRIRRGVERLRARLAPHDRPDARRALLLLLAPGDLARPLAPQAALGGTLAMTLGTKIAAAAAVCAAVLAAVVASTRETSPRDTRAVAPPGAEASGREDGARARAAARAPDAPADAASDPAEPAPRLRLRLVREDGGPVAGGTLVLHDGSRLSGLLPIPSEEPLLLEASPSERRVVALLPGRAPQTVVLPSGGGDRDLALPSGAVVAGRVLLEGRAPGEPVPLEVWIDRPALPQIVVDVAGAGRPDLRRLQHVVETTTALDGSFRVEGFDAGATGSVSPPFGWTPRAEDAGRFAAPRTDLTIDCSRRARIRGRLVRGGSGAPVGRADVVLSFSADGASASTRQAADAQGRFTVYVTWPRPPERADFEVVEDGVPSHRAEIEGPFDRDRDLGDVVLPDPWERAASLRVLGAAGDPVERAVAVFASGSDWTSERSGPDGLLRVPATAAESRVVVTAPGHGFTETTVAAGEATVFLPRGAALNVRVVGTCNAPEGTIVRIAGANATAEPPDRVLEVLRGAVGGSEVVASLRGGEDVTWLALPGSELVTLPWVRPGAALRIDVFDAYGESLARQDAVAPESGTFDVTLGAPPSRVLAGRVVDEAGRAIEGASVTARSVRADDALAWSGGWRSGVASDGDGRFELRGAAAAALAVVVDAPGRAPWARASVAPGDGSLRVVLARAARLRVTLLDARGEPAAIEWLQAVPVAGDPLAGLVRGFDVSEGDAPGRWVVEGLPPGEVDLVAGEGDAAPRFRVRTDAGAVELRLP